MDGCIYRTKDGECDLYAEGGRFKAFCDMEHCDNIAPTNADRIRAMTDGELADWFHERYALAPWCSGKECPPGNNEDMEVCRGCVRDWLKQEVEN